MLRRRQYLALVAAMSAPALGQDETPTRAIQAPYLDLPLRDLGDSFADPEYGFELRLPVGFAMVENIEQIREEQILPEELRRNQDGQLQRVQIYLFRNEDGKGPASILIRANEPPIRIQTPGELRNVFEQPDIAQNIPSEPVGKVYQFKMRGGDVGFFAEREVGHAASGGVTTHRQYMSYIRTGGRSLLIQFTAPKNAFEPFADYFKACLGSVILRDRPVVQAERGRVEPHQPPGFLSAPVLANLGVVAILFFCLLRFGPSRARGA